MSKKSHKYSKNVFKNQIALVICLLLQTHAFHLEFLLVNDYRDVWHFLLEWAVRRTGHAVAYTELLSECSGMSSVHDTQLCKQGSQNTQSQKYVMNNSTVIESFGQDLTVHHGKIVYTRATRNAAAFSFWVYISGLWRLINGAYLESGHKRQKISMRLHKHTPELIFCFLSNSIP